MITGHPLPLHSGRIFSLRAAKKRVRACAWSARQGDAVESRLPRRALRAEPRHSSSRRCRSRAWTHSASTAPSFRWRRRWSITISTRSSPSRRRASATTGSQRSLPTIRHASRPGPSCRCRTRRGCRGAAPVRARPRLHRRPRRHQCARRLSAGRSGSGRSSMPRPSSTCRCFSIRPTRPARIAPATTS